MQIIDAHSHMVDNSMGLNAMLAQMHEGYKRCGFDAVCLVADPSAGFESMHKNLLCFLYKLIYPKDTFVFAGLDYHIPGTSFDNFDFATQAVLMCEIGIDGYKMYEGKPNARKTCGNIPLTSLLYKTFFDYLERQGVPVALHLADPQEFWHIENLELSQYESGWFFGDMTHTSWRQIYDEVISVISRHTNLKVILPQFGYLLPDLPRLSSLLDRYPNLYYDIGPTDALYATFGKLNKDTRDFFEKYAQRIIFACTGTCYDFTKAHIKAERLYKALDTLELPDNIRTQLFSGNFRSLCQGAQTNNSALEKYCAFVENRLMLCPPAPSKMPTIKRTLEIIDEIRKHMK